MSSHKRMAIRTKERLRQGGVKTPVQQNEDRLEQKFQALLLKAKLQNS